MPIFVLICQALGPHTKYFFFLKKKIAALEIYWFLHCKIWARL